MNMGLGMSVRVMASHERGRLGPGRSSVGIRGVCSCLRPQLEWAWAWDLKSEGN